MIPEQYNIDELAAQLNDDSVVLGAYGREHPGAEQDIATILANAENQGRGSFGFVALDETPAQTADLRDIAQELLDTTNINTIIVRAPGSGAIVSDQYSRKTVELAQWDLLGNPDYVSAVDNYVASVSSDSTPWGLVTVGLCLVIVAAVMCTFLSLTLRVRASEKSARLKGSLAM